MALLVSCSAVKSEQHVLALPTLPQGPIELRVAHVVNPRLPQMNREQLQILLTAVQTTARDHLGVELRFTPLAEMDIAALFATIPKANQQEAAQHIFDFKGGGGDPKHLAEAFGQGLALSGEPLPAMMAFARAQLAEVPENSYGGLGAALATLQLAQIEHWRSVPALDGGPAIDASPYNEYMMWVALGYGDLPFDLVLTNQLIASVEDVDPAVHTAIRGGYSNGLTSYSKSARFGSYSVWSTFAYLSTDPWVRHMREDESYSPAEAAQLAGIGATHELGHLLFHLLHPYGNEACVMNPVPMFRYRDWAEKLSPRDCPMGSSPEMQPGAYRFTY